MKLDEAIASLETGKATVDIKATIAGKITKLFAKVGATVLVGNDFAVIDETAAAPAAGAAKSAPKAEEKPKVAEVKAEEKPKEAPKVEAKPQEAPRKVEPMPAFTEPIQAVKGVRQTRRVPLNRLRLTASQRLKEAQNTYAMLTTFNECDMSALTAMRKELGKTFTETHKARLGFMSAFVKAAVLSLQKYPVVNASIDGKEIVYHDYCDVSVAVGAPKGLMVPILRNCENMSFADIEKTVSDFGVRAKAGKLALEEIVGGTFTITNGGVFGSMMSTPIINMPQSAILGLHAIKSRPVIVDGKIEARPMMYIALSYDHRLIDGREAVLFLKNVKELVEDPRRMMLDI